LALLGILPAFLQISSGTYAEPDRAAKSLWESTPRKTQRKKKKKKKSEGWLAPVTPTRS